MSRHAESRLELFIGFLPWELRKHSREGGEIDGVRVDGEQPGEHDPVNQIFRAHLV